MSKFSIPVTTAISEKMILLFIFHLARLIDFSSIFFHRVLFDGQLWACYTKKPLFRFDHNDSFQKVEDLFRSKCTLFTDFVGKSYFDEI